MPLFASDGMTRDGSMRRAAFFTFFALVACAERAPSIATSTAASAPTATSSATTTPTSIASATYPAGAWPARPVPTDGPRVYARTRFVHVFSEPTFMASKSIGYLWLGGSVKLKGTEPVGKSTTGCKFYAIEPRGYVCVDGYKATLDPNDAIVQELAKHAPDTSSAWPYFYGESLGTLKNRTLKHTPAPKWPKGAQDTREELANRSTVAWTEEIETKKRTFLWTSDLAYVAKDRVRPYARVDYTGVHLDAATKLPLAFVRRAEHPKLRRDGEKYTPTGASWPRLAYVKLTGKTENVGEHPYWETTEDGLWIDGFDTGVVTGAKETPWKSPVRAAGETPTRDAGRRSWIEVSARHGWLVAYENDVPVFATMISAGKLGAAVPRATLPHQPPATTPIGSWPLRAKFVTTTMAADLESGEEFVHSDVPWSQHFYDKYLLHTAYWHDAWGEGRSGGCVNLAPIDAKWLFEWTDPKVPEGWHAYTVRDDDEPATMVVIH